MPESESSDSWVVKGYWGKVKYGIPYNENELSKNMCNGSGQRTHNKNNLPSAHEQETKTIIITITSAVSRINY